MTSELHLHPDRLRLHAARAAALAEELHAHLPGPDLPAAAALATGLRRAVRELGELSAAAADAAARASATDGEIARALLAGGGPAGGRHGGGLDAAGRHGGGLDAAGTRAPRARGEAG